MNVSISDINRLEAMLNACGYSSESALSESFCFLCYDNCFVTCSDSCAEGCAGHCGDDCEGACEFGGYNCWAWN